jgi:repressor LexA
MDMLRIPLLGEVPCGEPKEAIQVAGEYIAIPYDTKLASKKDLFALTANGLSMKDADILPGDNIIIDPYSSPNNGDIVVALIGNDATLKYYFERDGYIELRPANSDFKPIKIDDPEFRVIGKVIMKLKVKMYI